MNARASALDVSAVGLSSLCLVHCLLLPVASAALPLAGALAEAEWVHRVLVLMALPITAFAIMRHRDAPMRLVFIAPACLGLSLLLAAAFAEPLHAFETQLTVAGALLLATTHMGRWASRHARG